MFYQWMGTTMLFSCNPFDLRYDILLVLERNSVLLLTNECSEQQDLVLIGSIKVQGDYS